MKPQYPCLWSRNDYNPILSISSLISRHVKWFAQSSWEINNSRATSRLQRCEAPYPGPRAGCWLSGAQAQEGCQLREKPMFLLRSDTSLYMYTQPSCTRNHGTKKGTGQRCWEFGLQISQHAQDSAQSTRPAVGGGWWVVGFGHL